ncbi:helix-turn-helix domain-containing protein [Pseudorhodoferax soli]|uniref:AraC-like DNA-binding protein n=1 Tax=Pseudorhodoferax soli TaxID=545864 RepID=A0A368XM83_9BURK|nr:AraC family transcriptional regulator [Pseudorhodoferax soli]RCW68659.1 AraC-like DNA-binding protein [Pseudorhodoferax soli]
MLTRTSGKIRWDDAFLPGYTLSFVYRGQALSAVRTGSRTRELHFAPGSFFALPSGQHWNELESSGSVDAVTIDLQGSVSEHPDLGRLRTPWFRDAMVSDLCFATLHEHAMADGADVLRAECLGHELVARLCQLAHEVRGAAMFSRPLLNRHQQRRTQDLIATERMDRLSVGALAKEAGLASSQFALSFRNTFGRSVHRYVMDARLARARELLACGNTPLAEIAYETGFASQSHFTTAFGRTFGRTPDSYRRSKGLPSPTSSNQPKGSPDAVGGDRV